MTLIAVQRHFQMDFIAKLRYIQLAFGKSIQAKRQQQQQQKKTFTHKNQNSLCKRANFQFAI